MTYTVLTDRIGDAFQLQFETAGAMLSRQAVLDLWQSDITFCDAFSGALADIPFDAFFWETPALSPATAARDFECVVTPATALAKRKANPGPFSDPFEAAPAASSVIMFESLGRDADLVVPRDQGDGATYTHLAGFLRTAAPDQVRDLWRLVGETAAQWLEKGRTCWISTSGLGVSWLHVRIDHRPKYYSFSPYRLAPSGQSGG